MQSETETGCRGVSGKPGQHIERFVRFALAAAVALTLLLPPMTISVSAAPNERTLYLYHTHTKETGRFTYWRNGNYDQGVLRQLNVFLADWRTKEPTKMDPALFDLLWSVYADVRASQPISIVSSYRSPKTNSMLRSKSKGVAENSQHMNGKAIDFFIPGVSLSVLREAVMRHQVGGIGYYPTSGSPFVHADTGNVRAWPRMTRAQLKKVFPDGRTLHLPTDGKPLSEEGRRYAQAQWQKCRTVPCNGASFGAPATMLASLDEAPIPVAKPRTLMDAFFGNGEQQPQRAPDVQLAALGGDPAQRVVPAIAIVPMPVTRASTHPGGLAENGAPFPAAKSQRLMVATLYAPPTGGGGTALAALDTALGEPAPKARVLMSPLPDVVTAYAGGQEPGAEQALRMIIEGESGTTPLRRGVSPTLDTTIHTASISGADEGLRALKGMFDMTFSALDKAAAPAPVATALADLAESRQPNPSIELRTPELFAPELDHVNETMVHPVFMTGSHFAVMTEAEGYLDKDTELGPLTGRVGFVPKVAEGLAYDRFVVGAPLLVASR
jgi:uncharacterized protein YcbK (DUF882 family)